MIEYYPLQLAWWAILLIGLGLTGAGLWAYVKDGLPSSLGQAALPVSFLTAFGWFTGLPEATAWFVASLAVGLWFIGMVMQTLHKSDDWWHYGALAVAWFGKLIISAFPYLWDLLTGKAEITIYGWVIVLLIGLLVGVALLLSGSFRRRMKRTFSRRPSTA